MKIYAAFVIGIAFFFPPTLFAQTSVFNKYGELMSSREAESRTLTGATISNTFDIGSLIDTSATDETMELHQFLQYQFGQRIISGQTHDYYNQVKTLTGKSPMLRAGDFQSYTDGYSYLWDNNIGGHTFGKLDNGTVSSLINWYNSTGKKGIVSLHWHWHAPSCDTVSRNTFYTNQTNFDVSRAVIPGTPEYDLIIRDIDEIALQLKRFRDAGVPVLWRPLHEAGGAWFWWGAKGAAPCLALWDILIERLKNYHQLHNLIWVWSTPEPSWYPGNDKVDMIGYDSYPGNFNYTHQKTTFDNLYMLTGGEKLIAMTENGPIPDPAACLNQDAPWLYFMSWSDLVVKQNSESHIREVYSNPMVLTVESTNAKTGFDWRSTLYPENWHPGYKDGAGRFLHDFSYAGYHKGDNDVPFISDNIIDVTRAPYNADNTGTTDVTSLIQQALDDAGQAGGGVVYLPAGMYKISAAAEDNYALRIASDSTILRGSGTGQTYLINHATNMRNKDIIHIEGNASNWFQPVDVPTLITFDLIDPSRVIPVQSISGFNKGDVIIITSTPTDEFIAEHKMTGNWTASAIKGVAFLRRIDTVDVKNKILIIDAPTRYPLKKRDQARVYHIGNLIRECGIENISVGNIQNTNTGWDEESYTIAGTGAYEVHNSHMVQFKYAENCWIKNVTTFKPSENTGDYHLLSNGVKLNQCRFITVDSCNLGKPQYEGGGGNGYMYTLESNDCLVKNSKANHGRHNFSFKYPYSNGNVIHRSRGENSKYASDFHMYLSMSNLFDACVFNADFIESAYRPYGSPIHGYTSSQSVFYNTTGEAYHPDKDYIIDSRQFGQGYIIGTSGPASDVSIDPAEGQINGFLYNSTPRDFTEGIGKGAYLVPASLYLDQLERRKNDSTGSIMFQVSLQIRDSKSGELLPGCTVQIFNNTATTDANGIAVFANITSFFIVNINKSYCLPIENKQFMIYTDTTLVLELTKIVYQVNIKLLHQSTLEPIGWTSVIFNSKTDVTNDLGDVSFDAYGGSNIYIINKPSYLPESGSVIVSSDTTITFYLRQTHADIRFRLREGTTPVNNAGVEANESTKVTNSLGDALYSLLPVSVSYPYRINKSGYEEVTGSVYLTRDTTVMIPMTRVVVSNEDMPDDEIQCWPNPVGERLNITLPGSYVGALIQITDIRGMKIHHLRIENTETAIEMGQYLPGAYLLRIISGNGSIIRSLMKN